MHCLQRIACPINTIAFRRPLRNNLTLTLPETYALCCAKHGNGTFGHPGTITAHN
jgi:hypothetical protein